MLCRAEYLIDLLTGFQLYDLVQSPPPVVNHPVCEQQMPAFWHPRRNGFCQCEWTTIYGLLWWTLVKTLMLIQKLQ